MVESAQPVAPSTGNADAIGALFDLKQVHLEGPGAGCNNAFVLEVIHLNEGIMPVAVDQCHAGW